MLAKIVNDNALTLNERVVGTFFASKLALQISVFQDVPMTLTGKLLIGQQSIAGHRDAIRAINPATNTPTGTRLRWRG